MKKITSVLLALTLVLSTLCVLGIPAFALESGDFTYTLDGDNVTITAYNGSDVNLVIPAEIDGHPVVRIAVQAFRYNKTIKSIYINDSVTTIDSYAFRDCTALESVRLPETLTTLNQYTFYGCTKLNNVVVPASVDSIDRYAFGNCKALTNITIMGASTTLDSNAIYLSSNIETIYLHRNSPADSYNKWPSGSTKIYLEDKDPEVAKYRAEVKMTATGADTVADRFQLRITSVITDEDWDYNFCNTDDESATRRKITSVGIVAYRGPSADFDEDTAKAVVDGSVRNSYYSAATTTYISKASDSADAYFGAIVRVLHSTLENDVICLGFVNYLDINGTARTIFYDTTYTAPIVTNYDSIVSSYLTRYPYSA